MLSLDNRISLMTKLGTFLLSDDERLDAVISRAHFNNQWFTIEHVKESLHAIAQQFLDEEKLINWTSTYPIVDHSPPLWNVGLILAGNIPLVGFHDVLCTFMAGHRSLIKVSSKDPYLLPFITEKLISWEEEAASYFEYVERLSNFDAVIATGSNNSASQFEIYFAKYPNIIRRNRNGIAVLHGKETDQEIVEIGKDIFSFFGLGCRNVSKIYIPDSFDEQRFLSILHEEYKSLVMHHKYKNNYDYNYAIYLMNRDKFLMNGSIIFKEDPTLHSRIACLHYERYTDIDKLSADILLISDQVQCIISNQKIDGLETIAPGSSQSPTLMDYADGVDTMRFLTDMKKG